MIPYDYAATFAMTGRPGNAIQDVINISPDGVFVATAIGYGFEEERGRPLNITLTPEQNDAGTLLPGDITLGQLPADALLDGFRVNPRFEPLVFQAQAVQSRGQRFSDQLLPTTLANELLQRVKPPEEISFLFSIIDTATGRELQDEPTHNLASLGISNGERPFRLLAHPVTFMPRSTIRLEVIERSEGLQGALFIVLYGYKVLASPVCPEPVVRRLRGPRECPVETIGAPSQRVIPYDYVSRLELTGKPGNVVTDELAINAEGGFVATALGYGLAVDTQAVEVRDLPGFSGGGPGETRSLAQIRLRAFPADALTDGIRIRSNFVRIAFQNNGALADAVPVDLVGKIFERLNRPDDVSFRYSLFDAGRGLELQNRAIHNIAGLGIANGIRPFKKFARAMVVLPRTILRVSVEERFGRGALFVVFQGYKLLGGVAPRGGPRR